MYEVIKSVISAGGFKLADMQYKVKKLWLQGDLTEEQADQLLTLAAGGANADAERPELLQMIHTLAAEVADLKARVDALAGGETGGDTGAEETGYPAWKPWDGISTDYQTGAVVTHNGEVWESVYTGQNVWEPGTVGEQFWVKYTG